MAENIGMTVERLMEEMSVSELVMWAGYFREVERKREVERIRERLR